MTSLKPVLNLPAAGVDIITILCHRWKPTVNYAYSSLHYWVIERGTSPN